MKYLYVKVDTGFVGATHEDWIELPDDWDELSPQVRHTFEDDCIETSISNSIDACALVVEKYGDTE